MSDDPDIASDQTAQDDAKQAAAAHDLDADTEFAPPDGMASDDRSDGWGISGEEGEAGEGNAEVSWDAATATSAVDDSPDDELDIPRGDAFIRLLVLGQTTTAGGALAPFLRQLRIDLSDRPNETGAFELFVDDLDDPALNSDDLAHAVPVLAALTARTIVPRLAHGDGRVSADARQRLVREAVAATRQLMRNRREGGLAPLPTARFPSSERVLRRQLGPRLEPALRGFGAEAPVSVEQGKDKSSLHALQQSWTPRTTATPSVMSCRETTWTGCAGCTGPVRHRSRPCDWLSASADRVTWPLTTCTRAVAHRAVSVREQDGGCMRTTL